MNTFTGYELLWLFFLYSFGGWVLETVTAALKQKRFVNRGLVNGPFCVIYGITAVVMTVGLQELTGGWLYLFAVVYATAAEWISGHLIEKIFRERWWDYSDVRWNLDGYICLPASLIFGALGFCTVRFGNRLLLQLLKFLPGVVMRMVLLALVAVLLVDILASCILLFGHSKHAARWAETDERIDEVSEELGSWISQRVERRIRKAYPKIQAVEARLANEKVFAAGCGFYKVVMLFFIGAFLGDITETIFCRVTAGVWMSRSSVVCGPFSIVWGLAIALATALLYKYKNRSDRFLFLIGTLLGGAYEYLCSVFTELVFGKVFWDYSKIPFNLGGRINLLYCFFWGIAAVVWLKLLCPLMEKCIEKLPVVGGKLLTWALIVFMCCNVAVSCVALVRHDQRSKGVEATSGWQKWADVHYDDAMMAKIYPNAIETE